MDQPGVVASPARGHPKKRKGEKMTLYCSHFPHSRLIVVLTYGIPPIKYYLYVWSKLPLLLQQNRVLAYGGLVQFISTVS